MAFYVYFLYSQKAKNVYIGCTKNLRIRVEEHQKGLVKSTKNRRPFLLIHSEKYNNLGTARRREDYLKSLYGARERKRIIKECLERPYTQN